MAEQLFLKYGLRSVSIDDICNELHISKKTFYQYFRQKEQLVKALLDRRCDIKENELPKYGVDENMVDVILEHGWKFASKQSVIDRHIAFIYDLKKYYPHLMNDFTDRMNVIDRRNVRAVLIKGQEQGMFRKELNVKMTSFFLTGMTTVMLNAKIEGTTLADKTGFGIDAFLRLVCNETGMKRYEQRKAEKNTL